MFRGFENFRNAILIVLGISLMYIPIIYFAKQEETQCDEAVFLEGELSMDVRYVHSYDNGMSTIHLCDGQVLRVPTRRIIKIVDKDVR
jgi:hypothetical protein